MRPLSPWFPLAFLTICFTMGFTTVSSAGTETEDQNGPRPNLVLDAKATAIAFSPDGKRLAVAVDDRSVNVYERATGKQLLTLKGHTLAVTAVAVSPDGKLLASAGCSGTRPGSFELRLWNIENGSLLHQVQEQEHRSEGDAITPRPFLSFSPDGKFLAFPGKDRTVQLWDTKLWKPKHSWKVGLVPSTAVFSADGNAIAIGTHTGDSHGTVKLFEVQSGMQSPSRATIFSGVLALAFSPDGKNVLSCHRHWIYRLEVESGKYKPFGGKLQKVDAAAFVPGGDRIALVIDGNLELRETQSGRTVFRLQDSTRAVAVSPDGKVMATGSMDGKVKLWFIEQLEER